MLAAPSLLTWSSHSNNDGCDSPLYTASPCLMGRAL